MTMNKSELITYLLEAAAIALVGKYVLGKSPLDTGIFILIASIAVAHMTLDRFAPKGRVAVRDRDGHGGARRERSCIGRWRPSRSHGHGPIT